MEPEGSLPYSHLYTFTKLSIVGPEMEGMTGIWGK